MTSVVKPSNQDFPVFFTSWWKKRRGAIESLLGNGLPPNSKQFQRLRKELVDWCLPLAGKIENLVEFLRLRLEHECCQAYQFVSNRIGDFARDFDEQVRLELAPESLPDLILALGKWTPGYEQVVEDMRTGKIDLSKQRSVLRSSVKELRDRLQMAISQPTTIAPDQVLGIDLASLNPVGQRSSEVVIREVPFGPGLSSSDVQIFELAELGSQLPVAVAEAIGITRKSSKAKRTKFVGIRVPDSASLIVREVIWATWRKVLEADDVLGRIRGLVASSGVAGTIISTLIRSAGAARASREDKSLVKTWHEYIKPGVSRFLPALEELDEAPQTIRDFILLCTCLDLVADGVGSAQLLHWPKRPSGKQGGIVSWCGVTAEIGSALRGDLESIDETGVAKLARFPDWSKLLKQLPGLSAWVKLRPKDRNNRTVAVAHMLRGNIQFLDEPPR